MNRFAFDKHIAGINRIDTENGPAQFCSTGTDKTSEAIDKANTSAS